MWLPAFLSAAPEWRDGDYYQYGWFIPPAMIFFWLRRWGSDSSPKIPMSTRVLTAFIALWLPWILFLRILSHVDPAWRLPMILLGWTAVLTSHTWITLARGWRFSGKFVWISLLGLSAIPWPSVFESWVVHQLTNSVISTVAEIFRAFGKPVEILGDRLRLNDITVTVTDGCSGVRSFQSFLMATWFFAELQNLRPSRVAILFAGACACAFLVNTARTYTLASIRFDHGEAAFAQAHDPLGLLAFLISAVFFYWLSGLLGKTKRPLILQKSQSSRK